ncbi:MAG: hypothetical protein JWR26_2551 [Pedosphaera sp.]|nr:hypothetical protein [Pedosphaera sp.]
MNNPVPITFSIGGRSLARAILKLAFCIVILGLNGCAVVVPLGREALYGQDYLKESIAFLDAPGATREETIVTLGPPYAEFHDRRVLVYFSETTGKYWHMVLIPYLQPTSGVSLDENSKRQALLISYDEHGHITGHTFRDVTMVGIQDGLMDWPQPKAGKEVAAPKQ